MDTFEIIQTVYFQVLLYFESIYFAKQLKTRENTYFKQKTD